MQIEVNVTGQKIERLNSPGSVEDTLNYLTCHFTFDGEEWDNTVKTAHFQNYATKKIYSALLTEGNTCVVPWEALTDQGFVKFSVAGERENYRITTDTESFYNGETVYGGEPSEPPTPSQYDQLIALAEQTKKIAESVRSDADAGKFDGEPGKPGDPGKDGVSPSAKVEETNDGAVITVTDATGATTAKLKNGKDGNPGQNATDEQVQAAVDAYMEEHPIQGDTEDIIKLAIKNEASGAVPITITDSADMGVQDLEMQGWTEQAQYEGKNLFDIASSGFPQQDKERVVFDNSDNKNAEYLWTKNVTAFGLQGGKTYTSRAVIATEEVQDGGDAAGTMWKTLYLQDNATYSTNEKYAIVGSPNANGICYTTFTLPEDISALQYVATRANGYSRTIFSEIMIVEGNYSESNFPEYEPYTGRKLSPNPDYPQEITSAGKYDEGMGKYQYTIKISDSEESPTKSQTVALTSDRPLTKWDKLEKRNGQWGWGYKSAEKVLDGTEGYVTGEGNYISDFSSNCYTVISDMVGDGRDNAFMNRLSNIDYSWTLADAIGFSKNLNQLHVRISNADLGTTGESSGSEVVAAMKAYMAQQYEEGNPFVFWYETAEETFVPLSESEQEALNALRTYYPATTVSNDAGCDMSLTYIADTKAYIDSKIAAIQAAVVNRI